MYQLGVHCPFRSAREEWRLCACILAAAIVAGAFSRGVMAQGLPCHYELDLVAGPSCGTDDASAFGSGISDEGHLCGWYACPGGDDRAFVAWNAGVLVPLTFPPGAMERRAVDVNGDVLVGHYATANGYRGFRSQGPTFTTIEPLPGGDWVEVERANPAGVIVGAWGNTITGPFPRAFRWESGVLQDIAAALVAGKSRAFDIADNGAITGFMGQTAFPSNAHAFIWQNGQVTDLGLMPGSIGTEGRAINSNNQVVGIAWFTSNNSAGYVRRGFFWQSGVFTDLGTLPGFTEIFPRDIAQDGTVVAQLVNAPGGSTFKSVVWKAGIMRDITALLIGSPPGVFVENPRGINASGQIADTADMFNHANWGARLRPVNREPGDTNCDTVVNVNDLLTVISQWGMTGVDGDVNADWIVNVNDLLMVITNWG